jgi:class 3 adenylate cyclase
LIGIALDAQLHKPALVIAMSTVNVLIGVGLLAATRLLPTTLLRFYPPFAYIFSYYAGIAITVNLYGAGNVAAVGTVVYLLAPIFGFYLLSTVGAVLLVLTVGIEYAVLLALQSAPDPFGQWIFLMATVATAAVLVGRFVRRADELAESEHQAREALTQLNDTLEQRVAEQVAEVERLGRLRRFLSPQVVDAILSSADAESILAPHRREIAVFFSDLRGFTSFASTAEPEDVLEVLNAYYEVVGQLIREFKGTVGGFAGDGIMAYFNDPVPCEAPAMHAVEMAVNMKDSMAELTASWHARGYQVGYGVGIALGHATLGMIGFEGRNDYTPLGTVVNLGARLCSKAAGGQVLIDQRTRAAISSAFNTTEIGEVSLKGFHRPIQVAEVLGRWEKTGR